jgi:4,5-DOPA dioxygenase extradiol
MDRRKAVKSLGLLSLTPAMMNLHDLSALGANLPNSDLMPVLFVGHGAPTNIIEENEFTKGWVEAAARIPRPNAILCISAHWLTQGGTAVTAMEQPRTIHDFYGFPKEMYEQSYPAPGSPQVAQLTKESVSVTDVAFDHDWGFDHGSWCVVKKMYPDADIPMLQLSIDYKQSLTYHYELGKELAKLRSKGVLIMGSGNLVHNLRAVDFRNKNSVFDWAEEFDSLVAAAIDARDDDSVINYRNWGKVADMAHPTNDHYLPVLYTLGATEKKERLQFFNEKSVHGSISMRSFSLG